MLIPFIFTLTPDSDLRYLWIFYKYLDMAKKYGFPIIAQEEYFVDPIHYSEAGRPEVGTEYATVNEYDLPTIEDINLIKKYIISKEIIDNLIKEKGSQTDAWIFLLKNRYEPMEKLLGDILDDIASNSEEEIDAILTFCSIPSLGYVASQRNIPIIHNEVGPFRNPAYRKTAYMDFSGLANNAEIKSRYANFREEIMGTEWRFLSRKEILSLILDYSYMKLINSIDSEPQFEMGISTQYSLDHNLLVNGYINNIELITMSKRYYEENEIILRTHPGDPSRSKYSFINNDNSSSSFEFITKCKRIATIASNVAFESMLLGKPIYSVGKGTYTFKCQSDLAEKRDEIVDLEFINFVVFGYLIPYEFFTNTEYIKWRLTRPNEIQIYNKNLEYYLASRGVDLEVLKVGEEKRLFKMLETQGFDVFGHVKKPNVENEILIKALTTFIEMTEKDVKYNYICNNISLLQARNNYLEDGIKWYRERVKGFTDSENQLREYINVLEKSLNEKDKYINDLEKVVEEKDRYINDLEKVVEEKDRYINDLENVVDEKDKYISNLDKTIAEKTECLLRLEESNISLNSRIDESNEKVTEIEVQNRHLREKIFNMETSFSWRVTGVFHK